ncbi:MAG: hypothetical protein KBC38_02520 [Candidatus Pacebacteria bacterium]|nr:hypothetical protein [Candidatus Paceibacterota bacterium]MBP9840366.1 hypothetical protein [Candidatus Paceibacterota bacterium]
MTDRPGSYQIDPTLRKQAVDDVATYLLSMYAFNDDEIAYDIAQDFVSTTYRGFMRVHQETGHASENVRQLRRITATRFLVQIGVSAVTASAFVESLMSS